MPVLYWIEVRRGSRLQVLQLLEGGAGELPPRLAGSEETDQDLSLDLVRASGCTLRMLSKVLLVSSIFCLLGV